MSKPNTPSYKTLNWLAYNEALRRRGSLTIWFDPGMLWAAKPTGKRGRQPVYSDAAVQTCLTMKVLLGMALRQTTGFVESLLRLVGMDWAVPDFSTLSRRQKTLAVNIPHRGSQGPLHLLIDSTGIKVEGEGESNARNEALRAWKYLGRALATMERLPPPKPRRDQNALRQTPGSASHGAKLRPSGCGVPGSCCRPERLHGTGHPCNKGRGIGPSGRRGTPALS
jgi:hypothetical protein